MTDLTPTQVKEKYDRTVRLHWLTERILSNTLLCLGHINRDKIEIIADEVANLARAVEARTHSI